METSEILKKVRQIEIKTRGLSNNIFAGQYHSAFKGRGMSFSEVREYQFGDDIRDIDWNVTARFNKPYVKVFEEERELTVMLMVDVSGSLEFGTVKQLKKDMVTEIAATLAFSAIQNNDKIQSFDDLKSIEEKHSTGGLFGWKKKSKQIENYTNEESKIKTNIIEDLYMDKKQNETKLENNSEEKVDNLVDTSDVLNQLKNMQEKIKQEKEKIH